MSLLSSYSATDMIMAAVAAAQGLFTMISPLICSTSRSNSLALLAIGFVQIITLVAQAIFKIQWVWVGAVEALLAIAAAGVMTAAGCASWVIIEMWVAAALFGCAALWFWHKHNKKDIV